MKNKSKITLYSTWYQERWHFIRCHCLFVFMACFADLIVYHQFFSSLVTLRAYTHTHMDDCGIKVFIYDSSLEFKMRQIGFNFFWHVWTSLGTRLEYEIWISSEFNCFGKQIVLRWKHKWLYDLLWFLAEYRRRHWEKQECQGLWT